MQTLRHTVLRTAALASIGAGVIHAVVVPDHARVWWVSGTFFALLALVQLAWGATILLRPGSLGHAVAGRLLVLAAVVVNLGAAALWALTRTSMGEPFGPRAGTPLPVGPAGIASTALECLAVALLLGSTAAPSRRPTRRIAAALLAAGALLVAAPTAWGVTGALAHDHGAHEHESGPGSDEHPDDGHHDEVRNEPSPDPDRARDQRDGHQDDGHQDDGHQDDGHQDDGHQDDGHGH